MYTIRAQFQQFWDVDLAELIASIGVYVIWDARARAKPTYIGEGNILKRFTDHVERDGRRFAHPWDGYAAIISGSTRYVHKEESRAVERLLLDVAKDTDRTPSENRHPGSMASVLHFCRTETLRVAISGYDPLAPPRNAKPLLSGKEIKALFAPVDGKDDYEFDYSWRLRRLRAPIT